MALTLIKENQAFLLEASSVPDVCERFRQITKGNFVTECHSFMQVQGPGSLGLGRWSEGPEQAQGSAGPTERGCVGTHGPPGGWGLVCWLGCASDPGHSCQDKLPKKRPWLSLTDLRGPLPFGLFPNQVRQLALLRHPVPMGAACLSAQSCVFLLQKIFSEPGSLPTRTIARLRDSCRAQLLAQG